MNNNIKCCIAALVMLCCGNAISQNTGSLPLQQGFAVVTCTSGDENSDPNGFVLGVMDITCPTTGGAPIVNTINSTDDWTDPSTNAFHHSSWTASNLGEIFGLALGTNNPPDIFVGAGFFPGPFNDPVTVSIGTGGAGAIYKIDGTSGVISTLTTLPGGVTSSTGEFAGIGNIASFAGPCGDVLYVSNLENGLIYVINQSGGGTVTTFDHGANLTTPVLDDGVANTFTDRDRVVFGLQVNVTENRLYYGAQDAIYSVSINNDCSLDASTIVQELTLGGPNTGSFLNIPMDIAFTADDTQMLYNNQHIVTDDSADDRFRRFQHYNDVIVASGGTGSWATNISYDIGPEIPLSSGRQLNSAGGLDFGYSTFNCGTANEICDDAAVIMSEPGLWDGDNTWANRKDGLQISSLNNGDFVGNSYVVDLDGQPGNSKYGNNDVEVFSSACLPCTNPAAPVVSVTDNVCPSTTGTINIDTPCAAGSHIEYSTDGGVNWTTTQPTYTSTAFTFLSRCIDDVDTSCFSTSDSDATNPTICSGCTISNPGIVKTDCTTPGTIAFILNPQGGTSPTYTVSASSGTVTPSSSNFGQGTKFALSGYSGATVTITIADSSDPSCNETFDIDTGTCNYLCNACSPVCTIIIDSVSPSTCDSNNNTYDLDVTVEYIDPASGDIQIDVAGISQTFTPDGSGTETFTVTGLPADGSTGVDVSTSFVNDGGCRFTGIDLYDTPDCSPVTPCSNPQCTQNNEAFVCSNGTDSVDLVADAGLTNIEWFDGDGNSWGTNSMISLTNSDIGTGVAGDSQCFYYTAQDSNSCDGYTCCPIIVTVENCCPDNNCFGLQITPNQ